MKKFREKLSEAFDIPKEISMDYPHVTVIGKDQLFVQNGKGIVGYTNTEIHIHTTTYFLKILGTELTIRQMNGEMIEIRGNIQNICLED
ncbi:MAG: hypothetical protein IKJ55_04755 [Clostridia bacterium]|nr:hypothetical protein [Clostridia bacterium]